MKRICSCFALALGLPLAALNAQAAPALAPGARVRVIALQANCIRYGTVRQPCYREVVGSLESIDSATIVVRPENGTTVALPREPATRLDVSGGPGSCSGGARAGCIGFGFLGGAAVGALAGLALSGGAGLAMGYTTPPGAVLGMIVGAVVGGGEKWKRTPMPTRLSVGPDGSGRFSFGLSVGF